MSDTDLLGDDPAAAAGSDYRVLARKYRPRNFEELIGQEPMVRTLRNAIAAGRLAHAFILTGVRGVGKTTTARIIAKALNYAGPDGAAGPTADLADDCDHCRAIDEGRHPDVIEMDAASRTGVDDIREIIEGVRYKPSSARYKVYIIDEVHMLSRNAFNALLKTLEEPPEHVKFIFATTEIRKVPVTVLSRCQRFDLRRVDIATLTGHFAAIAGKEGASVDDAALGMIARAADGSVRDGLSLLDQAVAHAGPEGAVGEAEVRDMLGLADREQVFDLLDALFAGKPDVALGLFGDMYVAGADPGTVIADLLELVHWLTRIKVTPAVVEAAGVPELERTRGTAMADGLSMPVLTRAWQLLLKGLGEVQHAINPQQAAEMVLVRLAFAAELPDPGTLLRKLEKDTAAAPASAPAAAPAPAPAAPQAAAPQATTPTPIRAAPPSEAAPAPAPAPEPAAEPAASDTAPALADFPAVVALFKARREARFYAELYNNVRLVRFEQGRIELVLEPHAVDRLANRVGELLSEWTGRRWVVVVNTETAAPADPSLADQDKAAEAARKEDAAAHPAVREILAAFPDASIRAVRAAPQTPDSHAGDPADQPDQREQAR
jgi:DNA polymerase-3 subunit gamma/tau